MNDVSSENEAVSPSVRHVVGVLEGKIRSGEYRDGQWLPSERALAEEFRVSRVIVREAVRAMEGRRLIVRSARCRPIVRTGGNGALPPVTPLPTRRRSIALLVWPNPNWPGSAMLVQGIRQTLSQDEYRFVLETAMGNTWQEINASEAWFLKRLAQDQDIEGLILWYLGGEENLPALEAVRAANIPMVFLDRRPPAGFDADFVGVDNVRSAEQAVRHLLTLGHTSIAHISNRDQVSTVEERMAGYRRALSRAGLPARPELIQHTSDDYESGCEVVVDRLLALPDPPTAIFTVNDLVAFHVIEALQARGLRVPDDMSVVGFDGIDRWSPGAPSLTTADQPFERMGAQAAELLQERMEGETPAASPYRHLLLDAPLSVRGTTARHHHPEGSPSTAAPAFKEASHVA